MVIILLAGARHKTDLSTHGAMISAHLVYSFLFSVLASRHFGLCQDIPGETAGLTDAIPGLLQDADDSNSAVLRNLQELGNFNRDKGFHEIDLKSTLEALRTAGMEVGGIKEFVDQLAPQRIVSRPAILGDSDDATRAYEEELQPNLGIIDREETEILRVTIEELREDFVKMEDEGGAVARPVPERGLIEGDGPQEALVGTDRIQTPTTGLEGAPEGETLPVIEPAERAAVSELPRATAGQLRISFLGWGLQVASR
jgi:hypothetical protein